VKVVADAGPIARAHVADTDAGSSAAPVRSEEASAAPRRLSDLAGDDAAAWASANAVRAHHR
jgi:hypothetical protein